MVSLVLVPIVVSIVLGLLAYDRYQSAHCEYCLWKSLTFMPPFLGVASLSGSMRLGFRWWRPALRIKWPRSRRLRSCRSCGRT